MRSIINQDSEKNIIFANKEMLYQRNGRKKMDNYKIESYPN